MSAAVFDSRACTLGEGALWHPELRQLFWFDIIERRLLSQSPTGQALCWQFNEHVSAAGWIDEHQLLIASETALNIFDLANGEQQILCALEADNPITRSNDGRADPWGGFWIGTMGKQAEPNAGAIYRYYRGELRQLQVPVTIPNAICFSPDGLYAYFADTTKGKIWRQSLEQTQGWPVCEAAIFVDCGKTGVNPDGAVVDAAGRLWNAQWGASSIACYDRDGRLISSTALPTENITCPAFGGPDLSTLFATSATQDLTTETRAQQVHAGKTFAIETKIHGQKEHRIYL